MEKVLSLISLLDDPSNTVRLSAVLELKSYGKDLEWRVNQVWKLLNKFDRERINNILFENRREYLKKNWAKWYSIEDEFVRLEVALHLLSEFISGYLDPSLNELLDELEEEFKLSGFNIDPLDLVLFLHQHKGLNGSAVKNYDSIDLNSLIYAIQNNKGLPITICSVYILLARRFGFEVTGVNYPQHFLVKLFYQNDIYLIDCYNSGQTVNIQMVKEFNSLSFQQKKYWLYADTEMTIHRFLVNITNAFKLMNLKEEIALMDYLWEDMKEYRNFVYESRHAAGQYQDAIHFKVGGLVLHKRYGYRGVVVAYDPECKATDDWYFANQSQPDRLQPWYHILVDGTNQVTYAAQNNLEHDFSGAEVRHPMLHSYFDYFQSGNYLRNSRKWEQF